MHKLPWMTIWGSRVRQLVNDFHEWRSVELKSWANRLKSDPKAVILGNECLILFFTPYYMSWTQNCAKNQLLLLVYFVISDRAFFMKNIDGKNKECTYKSMAWNKSAVKT